VFNSAMVSLEMEPLEEELSSLVHETCGDGVPRRNVNEKVTLRKKFEKSWTKVREGATFSNILERNYNFTARNMMALGFLGFFMLYFILHVNTVIESFEGNEEEINMSKFHSSSLGGASNVNQPAGAKAAAAGHLEEKEIFIPVSNIGHAVPSVTEINLRNLAGHYLHDEHRSPFASHLYDKTKEELDAAQQKHDDQMAAVRKEWGAWNFTDPHPKLKRDAPDFDSVDYRDLKNSEIPDTAWQKDEEYVRGFIKEGKDLVNRVIEGVYAEFGHPTKKADGTTMTKEEKLKRHELFQVVIAEKNEKTSTGVAWLTPGTWDGFIQKLLHAMITNDIFYFVLGGHSSACGHGNNFLQTQSMQFNHLMEPVFDKLGVKLISRNMAMGGLGTLHTSIAGAKLYGEADFMWWDSSMTEKGDPCDVFNKQAILSGERVPIILTDFINNLPVETNNTVWYGKIIDDLSKIVPESEDETQVKTLPWASQYVNCIKNPSLCRVYHANCWYPRKDVTPPAKQLATMPGRASWHLPDQHHKWKGRVVSLIFLQALEAAFEVWEAGISDTHPLEESFWHVGDLYKVRQESIRTYKSDVLSPCERFLSPYSSRTCRVSMSGATSFMPRRNGDESDLIKFVKPAPNGYKPGPYPEPFYSGVNVAVPSFDIPNEHVDAHAIAIATHYPPPQLNHTFSDEESSANETVPGSRRWLREESHKAWRKKDATTTDKLKTQTDPISLPPTATDKSQPSTVHRTLADDQVIPGQGWDLKVASTGYCDGSTNSDCGRLPSSTCLMYAHNDAHNGLSGDGLSGWLVFVLPKMKEGIIFAKMEWWSARNLPQTADWTEVNNGKTNDVTPFNRTSSAAKENGRRAIQEIFPKDQDYTNSFETDHRELKAKVPPFPSDFRFDVAINGKIVKSFNKEEFMEASKEIMHNVALYPFLDDEEMAKRTNGKDDETMELGIRVSSAQNPREAVVTITHLYWA